MVSHTFPGVAPLVVSTRTFDAFLDKGASKGGFEVAPGRLSPAVATNIVKFRFRNPSNSGKTAYLIRVTVTSSIATDFIKGVTTNPDAGAFPAQSAQTGATKNAFGQASVMLFSYNANDTNDINTKLPQATLQAGVPLIIPLGEVLPPNSSLDFRFLDTTTTTIYVFKLEWYEE